MLTRPAGRSSEDPEGASPGRQWLLSWVRIMELTEAIEGHYESSSGDAALVREWAKEIQRQCDLILRSGR